MIESLYIHIPFCNSICTYCSFTKRIYNEELAHKYVLNLLKDLERIEKKSLKTIFIGGGTPSSLSNLDIELLLSKLQELLSENYEFTIESNPENLSIDKTEILKKYGINRVSIGVQTFDSRHLKLLGRKHTHIDVEKAIDNLKKCGIDNINLDLIYGIPNQSLDDFINDIEISLKYDIKHISLYSLTIDEHTVLNNRKVEEANEDLLREMSDKASEILEQNGIKKYEVSNYSIDGHESKHNLIYWFDKEYYGIGIGASGYEGNKRYTNISTLTEYLKGERKQSIEIVDDYNHEYEYIMLNLRTKYGINFDDFKKIFNKDFIKFYQKEINDMKEFFIVDNESIKVKDNHYMILNSLIIKFIERLEVGESG